MKIESNITDRQPIEGLKSKFWLVFDILRIDNIPTEDYYVVLFIISLYKDGILNSNTAIEKTDIKVQIDSALRNSAISSQRGYTEIYKSFEPTLRSLSTKGLESIVNVISELDHKMLSENFPELFDSVLYNLAQSQGRHGGEFIQPLEITSFICGLFELPEGAKVYNPFAGMASFGVRLKKGHDYFGQELNQKTWALGALRILAYERQDNSKYVCEDSILNWPDESEKFDLIVSNPPYGMRYGDQYRKIEPGITTAEQFLIEKGVRSLTDEGKLIALLPQGFLYRGGHEKRIRETLVNEDLIESIIALPSGLLTNTGMPLIILVINKKKNRPGKVRLIKADRFVETKSSREKVLNYQKLLVQYNGIREDSDFNKQLLKEPESYYAYKKSKSYDEDEHLVELGQIRESDFNLNVPRYFQKDIIPANNEKLIKLNDILAEIEGETANIPENGRLVRISDLRDDKVDFRLNISEIEDVKLRRPVHQINESCLLLAMRGTTLKPTYFVNAGTPIYRNREILSFKVDESIADYEYLIQELHADYVQEQLETYSIGLSAMPVIPKDDLMEVVLKLPSLQEQRVKYKVISELSNQNKILQEELHSLGQGKTVKQFNEFASLKHTLGRPRQNILDWSDNLLDFFITRKEDIEALNKAFSEFYDIDINSALKEIKRDVNFITEVLEKGENGFVLSEYKKQIISLSDINGIINDLSNNSFIFKINKLPLKAEKMKERGIYANKTLFRTILDNILINANKYAFDKKVPSNEVVIELTEIDDFLSMEIRNNGKPFPRNFDREKFITKYSTADSSSGTGLGGYDIHRIATDFNNPDWILSLNEDPIFLVKFKFQFPIKLIN